MAEPPPPQEITDPEALRLMAHPLRHRIEHELRKGPVNSAKLARALGLSTGLASYHLRRLARYGFVEEVPELAKGRERWFQVVPGDRRIPPHSRQSGPIRAVVDELARREFADELEQFDRFQAGRDGLDGWADSLAYSRSTVRMTPAELAEFQEEYVRLLYRFKRAPGDTPEGARDVHTRFIAFPIIEEDGIH